jgi:hypothetical protein
MKLSSTLKWTLGLGCLAALLAVSWIYYEVHAYTHPPPHYERRNTLVEASLSDLPDGIPSPRNEVSFFADFKRKKDGIIRLYLINNTSKELDLPHQDADLYCRRVALDDAGVWNRVDPYVSSWCGNSYFGSVRIPARSFRVWSGRCDSGNGQKRRIKFQFFKSSLSNLTSNEVDGIVDNEDFKMCRYDEWGLCTASLEELSALATGKIWSNVGSWRPTSMLAIEQLKRFSDHPEFFNTIKTVLTSDTMGPKLEGEEGIDLQNFSEALRVLGSASASNAQKVANFDLVFSLAKTHGGERRAQAVVWMITYTSSSESLHRMIEEILATPKDGALQVAIHGCHKVLAKESCLALLKQIAASPEHEGEARLQASHAHDRLLPNPFLKIKVVHEGPCQDAKGLPLPFKQVLITNISDQPLRFPVPKPENLLRFTLEQGQPYEVLTTHVAPLPLDKSITLAVKETIVLTDVRWWDSLSMDHLGPARSYLLSAHAATPGLWEVAAVDATQRSVELRASANQ